jgi:hypothetical protein
MSKERKLLKGALSWMSDLSDIYADKRSSDDRIKSMLEEEISKIEDLLAQPEQENLTPRQGLAEYKKGYAKAEKDLKREPLSDDEIMLLGKGNLCLEASAFKPFGFARAVEKAHGIGETE